MGIKLTWTISTIIAVSSFISSVVVALINNKQQQKIHEMDLDYDKSVAELRVKQEIFHSQTEKNYTDKKNAYIRFIEAAGNFIYDPSHSQSYDELKRNCKKRSNEIAYRHAEIGRCVKKKFADCLEKDLEELRRPSKDT